MTRTIAIKGSAHFQSWVCPSAWPKWPGKSVFDYKMQVRKAGTNTVWQQLDPELELERPFGFRRWLAPASIGGIVGAIVVLVVQGLLELG
jgi:hypothetical protein